MKFIPFKRFVQSRKGGAWGQDAGKDEVDVSCVRVADFEYDKLTSKKILSTIRSIPARQYKNIKLNKGDILIEKSGGGETTLVGRAISFDQEIDTICSNFIERIEIKTNKLEPKFACYILASAYSNKINASCIKQTTGIQNLDVDAYLSSVLVPDIPKEKQRRIVDFLESKIKDISDSIFKKRVCLQKLSEYRQSLITQAVTKGLDPNVEMKDSGVEWIGHIPQSWSVPQVKYLFSVVCGATPSPSESNWGGDIAWIGPSDMEDARMIDHGARFLTSIGYKSCGTELVPVGSLILSTRAPIGKVAYACRELCTNQGCKSLVPRQNIETKYFYYVLQAMRSLLEKEGSGTTFMELSTSSLGSQKLPLPSNKEQIAIADYLDKKLKQLQITLDTTKKSIDRLTEYRTSLISAAVTGKIDISEVNQ